MLRDHDMSETLIKIQLPDGSVREVPRGTTPLDIATSISPRLAAAVVVARVRPLTATAPAAETEEAASEAAMYGAGQTGERIVDLTAPLT
jgi:threonyl-tRNA synthetase